VQAHRVLRELTAPVKDAEVAYRGAQRLVPRLAPVDLRPRGGSPLRRGGFYVITGGLGGVAGHLARYLSASFGARLLLLGRTEVTPGSGPASALRELGLAGQVAHAAVDVADEPALRAVIEAQTRAWGQPDGVFHLAGLFNTAPLAGVTLEALRDEMRAKVQGTRAVRAVLPDPCLFVGFGSVNAFFGGVTAGVYAAANRYLEAFVEAERALGAAGGHVVGFSMWNEVGMSAGYPLKEQSRAQGFSILEARKGIFSLRALLGAGAGVAYVGLDESRPRVRAVLAGPGAEIHELAAWYAAKSDFAASALDRVEVRDRFGTTPRASFTRLESLPCGASGAVDDAALLAEEVRDLGAPEAPPRTSTERVVATIWREVLKLEEVDVHRSFFELGGQSVLLVQVHHRLVQVTGRDLTMVDLLRYPTVSALATFLDSEQKQKPSYEKAAERAQKQRLAAQQRRPRRSLVR
jgi:hypothetical protein